MGGALIAISAPVYWLGLLALFLFSQGIGLVPCSPARGATRRFTGDPWHWFTLAPAALDRARGRVRRLLRAHGAREPDRVLGEDYIRTARAKGLRGAGRRLQARAPLGADAARDDGGARPRDPPRRRDPHRDRLQHPRHRALRLRLDRQLRPARRSRAPCCSARCSSSPRTSSSTSSTRSSTRGSGTEVALLEIDDLRVRFRTRDGVVKAVDGVSLAHRARADARDRRRVGSGKSVTALTVMGLTRLPNATVDGRRAPRRRRPARAAGRRAPAHPRKADRDDLPGSALVAAPALPGGRRRSSRRSGRTRRSPSGRARRRALEALARGRHPETRGAPRELPARALGRHAPARHDRDGAGPRSRGPDRRRADDRARRHRPGADPRPDRRAPAGARHGGRPHHPRPRRRRGDGRRGGGHVRGPRRRARVAPTGCSTARSTPTRGACCSRCPARGGASGCIRSRARRRA